MNFSFHSFDGVTGYSKLFCLQKKMICAKAIFYPLKLKNHAFILSRLNSWSNQDPRRCGKHKIMGLSSGNPVSQKRRILHWRGCETHLPELKWQLQQRKDPRCIRNFGSESYFSLVIICTLICRTYKKIWRTHKNLCWTIIFYKLPLIFFPFCEPLIHLVYNLCGCLSSTGH